MAHVIGQYQADALEELLSKEIKKHLRKFSKITKNDRSNFKEFLEDWVWHVAGTYLERLYQAYVQLEGRIHLLEIKY